MMRIEELAKEIKKGRVVALTGAGISSNAGLPTFRGNNGLWTYIDPEKFTMEFFRKNPEEWWSIAKDLFLPFFNARPTRAHYALAELESKGFLEAIITQNIDGLHQMAGSKNVIEIHGNVNKLKCILCNEYYPLKDYIEEIKKGGLPRCPRCGSILKTGAVLFGEQIPRNEYLLSIYYSSRCNLMLVIGTSLEVEPAATLPKYARENGAKIIYINKDVSEIVGKEMEYLQGDSDEILEEIVKAIK